MDNNSEALLTRWKREREDDEEEGRVRMSPDMKRQRTDRMTLSNGDDTVMSTSDHGRFMNLLTRLFPEQKRNILELILKGCGGDVIQTIETVLPSHEEALARGQMLASVQRGLFLGPPPPSSYSAFTPLSLTIPHGISLSAVDYHATSKCASGQYPGSIYYPGPGPVPSVRYPDKGTCEATDVRCCHFFDNVDNRAHPDPDVKNPWLDKVTPPRGHEVQSQYAVSHRHPHDHEIHWQSSPRGSDVTAK